MEKPVNITEASKAVFIAYATDAANWSGEPLVGGNVGGSKEERGNLTQLKRAGLITTFTTRDEINGGFQTMAWIRFTDKGLTYAAELGIDLTWIRRLTGSDGGPIREGA